MESGKASFSKNNEVRYLKGVGPKRAMLLQKLGIKTIADLLTYYPFRYEDRRRLMGIAQLKDGQTATIQATVLRQQVQRTRRGPLLKIVLTDGSGEITLLCFNQYYLKELLTEGTKIFLNAKFKKRAGRIETSNFSYEIIAGDEEAYIHMNRIVPVYLVTRRLNIRFLRTLIKHSLDAYGPYLEETIPSAIRAKYDLSNYNEAIKNIHFPADFSACEKAHQRLVFEEFFFLQLILALKKKEAQVLKGISYKVHGDYFSSLERLIPFRFTPAQEKVIDEILDDMQKTSPMNRLLQGDVGSGKTIVAVIALFVAVQNGYQVAIMAPTEILAEQHYLTLEDFLRPLSVKTDILTSAIKGKKREETLSRIRDGQTNVIVGTHALIEQEIKFHRLGLVIIDEQHKFGVMQRALLHKKGINPDVLVMTATPIPRTLGLTVYGDLDLSIIDELPPGRKDIITRHISERKQDEIYYFIIQEINAGRQVYIVYPLIEESEKTDLKGALQEFARLKKSFPQFKLGLLHGQLPSCEKEKVMRSFKKREIDILVSTTVIEVGIDVSNASVMLIEHAERFGLAQLHQLRGRIGRGQYQSYCLLLTASRLSQEAKQRISVMTKTNDGFKIAEEDLRLRGPGEFLGTRQHGIPELKIAHIVRDAKILQISRREAFNLINNDPRLNSKENFALKKKLKDAYQDWLPEGMRRVDLIKIA